MLQCCFRGFSILPKGTALGKKLNPCNSGHIIAAIDNWKSKLKALPCKIPTQFKMPRHSHLQNYRAAAGGLKSDN